MNLFRKFCLIVLVLCLWLSARSVAQEFPRVEVLGGYSYLHFQPEAKTGLHLNGWNSALQFNLSPSIGIKADVSGHYGTSVTTVDFDSYSLLFGPVVSNRIEGSPGFTPFLHALAGANRISAGPETAFAMAFGGGLDVNAARHISARVAQIDYLFSKHGTATHQHNVRVSAGVVFQLGEP